MILSPGAGSLIVDYVQDGDATRFSPFLNSDPIGRYPDPYD